MPITLVGLGSGQTQQTVTLSRKLRRFESFPHHHLLPWFTALRVWFSGRTSAFQADGAGSIPATRSIFKFRSYSSAVEHSLGKGEVSSSILDKSSIYKSLKY